MRIAIFNWRDLGDPQAGGAETSTHILAAGLAKRGHSVTWFTSIRRGVPTYQRRDGYSVVRAGSSISCRFYALKWLFRNRKNLDIAIDEVNTLPFFSPLAMPDRTALWMHQLAREVWLAEAPPLVAFIGYATERWMLRMYNKCPAITVSQSSAASIKRYCPNQNITVAENALEPALRFSTEVIPGRIGYVGRLVPSKRVHHIIEALSRVRRACPQAHLVIIGSGSEHYIKRLTELAHKLQLSDVVHFLGRVPNEVRDATLATLDIITMTSVREGWGLVVSEAARYVVPGVVYPVDGLVDSVIDGHTGIVTSRPTPNSLADSLQSLILDRDKRNRLGHNAMKYLDAFSESHFIEKYESFLTALHRN